MTTSIPLSSVLGDIVRLVNAEILAAPGMQVLQIPRAGVVLLAAALRDCADQAMVLEETDHVCDRVLREVKIYRADLARLRLELEVEREKARLASAQRVTLARVHADGKVIDLCEILAREQANGGAA